MMPHRETQHTTNSDHSRAHTHTRTKHNCLEEVHLIIEQVPATLCAHVGYECTAAAPPHPSTHVYTGTPHDAMSLADRRAEHVNT